MAWGDRWDDYAQNALSFCRDKLVLHGRKLHAPDVCGHSSDTTKFSRIFKRPLLCPEYAKIYFSPPGDLPLRVLDLANATPPWSSSYHFNKLRELHLDLIECDSLVEISEEELLGFLTLPRDWRACR